MVDDLLRKTAVIEHYSMDSKAGLYSAFHQTSFIFSYRIVYAILWEQGVKLPEERVWLEEPSFIP